jgi:hypothetical protein
VLSSHLLRFVSDVSIQAWLRGRHRVASSASASSSFHPSPLKALKKNPGQHRREAVLAGWFFRG